MYGFSSERKMASVLVRRNDVLRLYNKGAAEMVLSRCTAMVDATGQAVPMTEVGPALRAGGQGFWGFARWPGDCQRARVFAGRVNRAASALLLRSHSAAALPPLPPSCCERSCLPQ